ncbi:MAG: O-antigen ligase domain-containing protein [Myxococcales bacterium]|nr:O-antigen ligase domain-containing protein [Myxococcales bacterium]
MTGARVEVVATGVALLAVALAAGLEGGTEHRMGALAWLVALVAAGLMLMRGELPRADWLVRVAGTVILGVILLQVLPVPAAVRELVSPGQAQRMHRLGGDLAVGLDAWLVALTRFDLEVLFGNAPRYGFDVLAGARDAGLRPLAVSPSAWLWQTGQWAVAGLLVLVGWRIGRNHTTLLVFLLGMVGLALLETLFGFANRNGPSSGIGLKSEYLGSATGTFINRGHFAAFLNLALGALWGLAASVFPLLPEEVRRHAARKRRSSQPPGVLEVGGDKLQRLALMGFAAATLFVGLVASNARGPLVGLLVAAAFVGVWTRYRRDDVLHLRLGIAVPIVGVLFAAVALGPRGALGRFMTVFSGDVSVTARGELWNASLSAWLDAPLFGAGVGGWRGAFGPHELGTHLYDVIHAHSGPVEVLVELGAVGFIAAAVLAASFARAVARRLDVVEADFPSSVAIGALVGVLAVSVQSLADFPLRTTGVLVPFALFLGIVLSGLGLGQPGGSRLLPALGLCFGIGAIGTTGLVDYRSPGTRSERISEQAPTLLLPRVDTEEEAAAGMTQACVAARRDPFSAWQHVACAVAASRAASSSGGAAEALVADAAIARAIELHPNDPRVQLQAAWVWARLAEPTVLPSAFEERATRALMTAVAADGWRAEAAFRDARGLPAASIDRVGAAASSEPVSRSRTLYQYGIVLEERKALLGARAAFEAAAGLDPQFGPPAFRAGLLARQRADGEGARRWFHAFLAGRSRPVGMEGWTYFFLDEPEAAEVRFRRAVAADPKNRWAWEGLAAIGRNRGDPGAECEAWSRVLAITPADRQASVRVAELGC